MYLARSIPSATRGRGCYQAAFVDGDGIHAETIHNILDLPQVSSRRSGETLLRGQRKKGERGMKWNKKEGVCPQWAWNS